MFEMRTYDQGYRERAESRANTSLLFRMVAPSDRERLVAGFEALSDESLYTRFFTQENGLTEEELRLFTQTDGFDHFAMGAVELEAGEREGRGVAVARFVRCKDEPKVAEVTVTVIDEMRGQGIGRMLLERLVEAARERGVSRFRFELLGDNDKAISHASKVCPSIRLEAQGDLVVAETSSEGFGMGAAEGLFHIFRLIASRALRTPLEAGPQGGDFALEAVTRGG